MNFLLDTHIWLWGLLEPQRISTRVAEELGNPDNSLWVSPISSWEIVLLCKKGRLRLDMPTEGWISTAIRALQAREATLTHEVVFQAKKIELPHRDPADRLLAATALVYGLTLITADDRLLNCAGLPCLANR